MLTQYIADYLLVETSTINSLAATASHLYKKYTIKKRKGGRREIHHPSRELKAVQRVLLREIIVNFPVHKLATAYCAGSSIKTNAGLHRNSNYWLRLDFKSFFPSITADDIVKYLSTCTKLPTWWEPEDVKIFCDLVCRQSKLTIGAVTSPALSNALCIDLDSAIERFASDHAIVYSRYADDMVFSSQEPTVLGGCERFVSKTIQKLDFPAGLKLNKVKTLHLSRRQHVQITGLTITPGGEISLGRERKRFVRSLIHNYDGLDHEQRLRLAGMLAFCKSVEPEFLNRLVLKYGSEAVLTAMGQRIG